MMVTGEFLMVWGVLFESEELQSDVGREGVARAWSRGVCVSFSFFSPVGHFACSVEKRTLIGLLSFLGGRQVDGELVDWGCLLSA